MKTEAHSYREAMEQMVLRLEMRRYSQSTITIYRYMFRSFLSYLYPKPLHKVSMDDIHHYHHQLVTTKQVSRSYQNQSINAINPVGLKLLVFKI